MWINRLENCSENELDGGGGDGVNMSVAFAHINIISQLYKMEKQIIDALAQDRFVSDMLHLC